MFVACRLLFSGTSNRPANKSVASVSTDISFPFCSFVIITVMYVRCRPTVLPLSASAGVTNSNQNESEGIYLETKRITEGQQPFSSFCFSLSLFTNYKWTAHTHGSSAILQFRERKNKKREKIFMKKVGGGSKVAKGHLKCSSRSYNLEKSAIRQQPYGSSSNHQYICVQDNIVRAPSIYEHNIMNDAL